MSNELDLDAMTPRQRIGAILQNLDRNYTKLMDYDDQTGDDEKLYGHIVTTVRWLRDNFDEVQLRTILVEEKLQNQRDLMELIWDRDPV